MKNNFEFESDPFTNLRNDEELNRAFSEGILSFKGAEMFFKCNHFLEEARQCIASKGQNDPSCFDSFIAASACNIDTIDSQIFEEFTKCYEQKGFENCNIEEYEDRALRKLLEKPVTFNNDEKSMRSKIETKNPPQTEQDQIESLKEIAQNACPNQWKAYKNCFDKKGKSYQNCMKETKSMLFCTGQFFSKITAIDVENRTKEYFNSK